MEAFLAAMKALESSSVSANPYGPESGSFRGYSGGGAGIKNAQFPDINVNVLIDPKDLTTAVTSGQQNETASGIVVGTSRINKYTGGTGP
jgi:cell shape-determining protein MreC